jgi:hypothetical protein
MRMRTTQILTILAGCSVLTLSAAVSSATIPGKRRGAQHNGPRVKLTYKIPVRTFSFPVPVVRPDRTRGVVKAPITLRGGMVDRLLSPKPGDQLPDTVLRARRTERSVRVDLGIERTTGYGSSQRTTVKWLGRGSVGLPAGYTLQGEDKGGEVTFGLTRSR